MRIDLNNYEEWLTDYLDGNLDDQKSKEVEAFLLKHPHIAEEMDGLSNTIIDKLDDNLLDSSFKSGLLQKEILATAKISEQNYASTFAAYHEDDLDEPEQKELEAFLSKNEFLKKDFDTYGDLKLQADKSIVYKEKESLLKKEQKIVPIWMWSGIAAAILIIGFWILDFSPQTRPTYSPDKLLSRSIASLDIENRNNSIPQRTTNITANISFDQFNFDEEIHDRFAPHSIASISHTSIEIEDNDWQIQMELMQGYVFRRNLLFTQVDWSAIPSENSKSGFRLISSMLWKTTKSGVQSFGEDVFKSDLQALSSNNLETLTGGAISIKRPSKSAE